MRYDIQGAPYPVGVVYLDAGEKVNCQVGAMTWMSPNMKMDTGTGGGLGKVFSRAISGESLFQNTYTAEGGNGMIAFGSSVPGDIIPIELQPGQSIVAQKTAYLASASTVNFEIFFQKKIGSGFFGGEGFIMQKFTGSGMLLLEIDGSVVKYQLGAGESILIDTGYLAAMDATCSVEIEMIKGVSNVLLGGEGLFNTKVTGPGEVWLQTMPFVGFVDQVKKYIPSRG